MLLSRSERPPWHGFADLRAITSVPRDRLFKKTRFKSKCLGSELCDWSISMSRFYCDTGGQVVLFTFSFRSGVWIDWIRTNWYLIVQNSYREEYCSIQLFDWSFFHFLPFSLRLYCAFSINWLMIKKSDLNRWIVI